MRADQVGAPDLLKVTVAVVPSELSGQVIDSFGLVLSEDPLKLAVVAHVGPHVGVLLLGRVAKVAAKDGVAAVGKLKGQRHANGPKAAGYQNSHRITAVSGSVL